MAIRGSLAEASLGDVLQLLALGNKTGALTVAGDGMLGTVFFEGGRISHASVLNHRARFAERVLRDEIASAAELDALQALDAVGHDELAIANALLAGDRRREPRLKEVLRASVESAVYTLFAWPRGTFSFEPEVRPEQGGTWFSLNAESLLLEGARRLDEWSVVQRRIPSFDLVFELDEARMAESGAPLSVEQMAVARELDGTNDVQAVVQRSGLPEFEAGQALYALLVAGFAHEVGRSSAAAPQLTDARLAEHRNLGIAFYRAELLDEASRELQRVLEHRPDDAVSRHFLALVHLRRAAWSDAIALLVPMAASARAPQAVHLNLALAYEGRGDRALAMRALDAADANDPRVHVARAQLALAAGDADGVTTHLASARDAWGARAPSPLWYHLGALHAAVRGDHAQAQQLLEDGIALHPAATALHNNLAVVLERRGAYEAGAAVLEHALLQGAALPQLHKNLGDYLYRHARYDEADEVYARAVQLAPAGGPDVFLKRGNIAYRRGDTAMATEQWDRVLQLDPDNPMARGNLQAVRGATS
jgi:Tfp pilus assembly protein PilF